MGETRGRWAAACSRCVCITDPAIVSNFLREGAAVVLLCGGDKGSQQRDIERAGRLAKDWRQT